MKKHYRGFIVYEDYDDWNKTHKYYFREGDNYYDTTKPVLKFDDFEDALKYVRQHEKVSNEIYIEKTDGTKWIVYENSYEKIKRVN